MQRSLISNSSSLRQRANAVLAAAAAARRHQSNSSSSTAPANWVKPTEADQQQHDVEQVFRAGLRHHHIANTAYPIGHLNTIREYRVPRLRDQKAIVETLKGAYGHLDEMMLYAHVPFCAQRCQFCEYTVVNPKHGKQADVQEIYFDHMLKEIEMYSEVLNTKSKRLVGFDIGGGTPSMASIKNIERLMNAAHTHFKVDLSTFEISIETTPQIAASNPEKIQSYFDLGIRRISMGLQTTDFNLAKRLGRQDGDYVTKAVENIRKAGFKSFNIDLMYGFPLREGGRDSWPETVQDCINVNPDHITLYRMRYKGTKMAHLASRVPLKQVNAQEARARAILESNGYSGWIGKNTYSKTPGSSGCSDYLHRRVVEGLPYIGVGLGAQSFSHNTLAYNLGAVTKKLNQYLRSVDLGRIPIQDLYHLPPSGAMGKMAAVSFYFGGIDRKHFRHCFNQELDVVFAPQIKFLMENNLMVNFGERLQLTAFGKKHFAGVVSLFYAPAVQNHLMNLPGGEQFDSLFLEDSSSSSSSSSSNSVVEKPTASAAAAVVSASASAPTPAPAPTAETLEAEIRAVELSMSAGGGDWAKRLTNGSILMKVKGVVQTVPASSAVMTARAISSSAASSAPAAAAVTTTTTTTTTTTSPEERMSTGPYEFGNILFGGSCNQKCPFCIGQQLDSALSPSNLRIYPPINLDLFIDAMQKTQTRKLIFTGSTTDPQLYKYEEQLIREMRQRLPGIHISLHTNGMLAERKMDVFNQYDNSTISINSFKPEVYKKLHGTKYMPNLKAVMAKARIPIKLSCVLTEDNKDDIYHYIETARACGVKRIAFRHQFGDERRWGLFEGLTPAFTFCQNPVYNIDGVEVTYWNFDGTKGKSLNLFANGTLSEEYLLAKAPPVQANQSCSAGEKSEVNNL